MSDKERPANRLSQETSPYLRQHAHNPVDWHPWGPEALQRARSEDKPIFLSIGYSACHWCHVMEHESFEDEATARIMNEHFVNIKVDREERPDLDQIYMQAVVAMTRQGGWPMSVWLTPELEPFYAGTYFPPREMYGRPSFQRVCLALADVWKTRREEAVRSAGEVTQHLRLAADVTPGAEKPGPDLIRQLVRMWERHADRTFGGIGGAPKFPHSLELRLLLRAWRRFDDDDALAMARLTFDRMAMGGMYDHLGGGFHRYSTDERWLVPHFEKMLYDNALLGRAYLEAFQATGEPFYRQVVEETLHWVEREMTSPEGAFFSTLDADSEGEEGKFYVWSAGEVEAILGPELFEPFAYVYDVTPAGNWEGHNILNLSKPVADCARMLRGDETALRRKLTEARAKLLAVRNRRVWPGRDEKILAAWNGLMIAAFAEAAQVLDARYAVPAARAADYVLTHLRGPGGLLYRTAGAGAPAKLNAYLEDYAFLADALVSLYEATFEARWITAALELVEILRDQFHDAEKGGFFFVGRDHEPLIVRGKEPADNAVPSGNSMAAIALLRLARLTGRRDLQAMAEGTLKLVAAQMARMPTSYGQMLCALDFYLGPAREYVLAGDAAAADTRQALRLVREPFRPNKVVAFNPEPAAGGEVERVVPLLAGKAARDPQATLYVCENFACQAPAAGLEAIRKVLATG